MTSNFEGNNRSPRDLTNVIIWKNVSGETIPAFACIKITARNAGGYYEADKPDGSGSLHFFNGPVAVANNAYGESPIWNQPVLGQTDGTFGVTVGPVADSWSMTTAGDGYAVFSTPSSSVAAIILASQQSPLTVVLDGALAPASNALTTPSTATASVLVKNASGNLEDSGNNITVVNRFESISLVQYTLCVVTKVDREWRVTSADCDALGSWP